MLCLVNLNTNYVTIYNAVLWFMNVYLYEFMQYIYICVFYVDIFIYAYLSVFMSYSVMNMWL